jgi:hypothetical protein
MHTPVSRNVLAQPLLVPKPIVDGREAAVLVLLNTSCNRTSPTPALLLRSVASIRRGNFPPAQNRMPPEPPVRLLQSNYSAQKMRRIVLNESRRAVMVSRQPLRYSRLPLLQTPSSARS